MINFHKMNYYDVAKLNNLFENESYWHSMYNPSYLYLNKDVLKIDIAYDNDFTFIRIYNEDIGLCYYPPLKVNPKVDLNKGIEKIKEDCKYLGIDLNFINICEDLYLKLNDKLTIYDTDKLNDNIYSISKIILNDGNEFKKFRNESNKLIKYFNGIYYKKIKKEDFPTILEFFEEYRKEKEENGNLEFSKYNSSNKKYFNILNLLKASMDHLYELKLDAVMLYGDEALIGVAFGVSNYNVCIPLLVLNLEIPGCFERLFSILLNEAFKKARYVNMKSDTLNGKVFKIEKVYNTFRL